MTHVPTHPLPERYAAWLDSLLDTPIPPEDRATCDECPMCASEAGPPATAYAFDSAIKCCVYTPELPNFAVGAILADESCEGRESVLARIAARHGVNPLGLYRPPAYEVLYDNAVNLQGRSASMRCPHFIEEGGRCGIWAHRNHLCATWFCKHGRGALGMAFWETVKHLLRAVEDALSRHCALTLDVEPGPLALAIPPVRTRPVERVDGTAIEGIDDATWGGRWGSWVGREQAFYEACAAAVADLSWDDVLRIGGSEVALRARLVQASAARLADNALPTRLNVGRFQTLAMGAQGSLVSAYSPLDPLNVPSLLSSVLHYFDGRPKDEAFEAIATERGIKLDDALIRQLLDWGILVDRDD